MEFPAGQGDLASASQHAQTIATAPDGKKCFNPATAAKVMRRLLKPAQRRKRNTLSALQGSREGREGFPASCT